MPLYRIEFIGAIEIEAESREEAENIFECMDFPKDVEIGSWESTTEEDENIEGGIPDDAYLTY